MVNLNVESHKNLVRNKGFVCTFKIGALCPACSDTRETECTCIGIYCTIVYLSLCRSIGGAFV